MIHGGPGMATVDRFKLNNLSFAGPVVMGVGGECVRRSTYDAMLDLIMIISMQVRFAAFGCLEYLAVTVVTSIFNIV